MLLRWLGALFFGGYFALTVYANWWLFWKRKNQPETRTPSPVPIASVLLGLPFLCLLPTGTLTQRMMIFPLLFVIDYGSLPMIIEAVLFHRRSTSK